MKNILWAGCLTLVFFLAGGTSAFYAGCPHTKAEKCAGCAEAKQGDGAGSKSKCSGCAGAEQKQTVAGKKISCSGKCQGTMCPKKMKGVKTVSENIASGILITITAKDEETKGRAQELALAHFNPAGARKKCPTCPATVEGAEIKVTPVVTGVTVEITSKSPDTVKKIQEAAAKCCNESGRKSVSKKALGYICPMGCAESDKPGKCPKCSMEMQEKTRQ